MYALIPDDFREEQVFIREIWFEPNDSTVRLVYADWLEDHHDVRAQILRNDVQLLELDGKPDEESLQQREGLIRKRRRMIEPKYWEWIALVGCAPIDVCHARESNRIEALRAEIAESNLPESIEPERSEPDPNRIEFRFRCPMRWENLQAIGDDPNVRFCNECERSVHYCWDMPSVRMHARSGNCVAIDPSVNQNDYGDDHIITYIDRHEELGEVL